MILFWKAQTKTKRLFGDLWPEYKIKRTLEVLGGSGTDQKDRLKQESSVNRAGENTTYKKHHELEKHKGMLGTSAEGREGAGMRGKQPNTINWERTAGNEQMRNAESLIGRET